MLTCEELIKNELFNRLLEEMATEEPLESILRRAGREHHASSPRMNSGHAELVECVSCRLNVYEPERRRIGEIASFIACECIGGVLMFTMEGGASNGEGVYLLGQPEDVKAVFVALHALFNIATANVEPTIFTEYDGDKTKTSLGVLKGFLSKLAYAHDSKNSIDSSTMAVIKEKEAFATQQLKDLGVEPLVRNLTQFVRDCLDEISMEQDKEFGRSNW